LFALPIVFTVAALLIGARAIPNSREKAAGRFDAFGTLTSILATFGFTFALHEAPSLGWTDPVVLAPLVAAVLATALFILWELRTPSPLLDIRHFRTRGLSSGTTLLLVLFGVQGGVSLVLYPFFQVVLGWSGLLSTLAMTPMALLMMFASGFAPRLAAQIGARASMATGLTVTTIGLALMAALVAAEGGYLSVLPGLIAMSLGAGLAMTPSTEAITSSLPREQQGVASALNDLTRELGAALGIALLGGLLVAGYQNAIAGRLTGVPPELAATAREGIANAISQDAGAHTNQILTAANEAFIIGWQQSMWVGVAVMSILVLFVLFRGPKSTPREHPEGTDTPAEEGNLAATPHEN